MAVDFLFHVLTILALTWLTFLHLTSRSRFAKLEGSFFKRDTDSQAKIVALEARITQTLDEITIAHSDQLDRDHANVKKAKRKTKAKKAKSKSL